MNLNINKKIEEALELPERPNRADLRLTHVMEIRDDVQIAFGCIENDYTRRFTDGCEIRTSAITDLITYQDELYLVTRNTIYRLVDL
ncbi:hypothetical protein D3C80_882300 [compost metagenome]